MTVHQEQLVGGTNQTSFRSATCDSQNLLSERKNLNTSAQFWQASSFKNKKVTSISLVGVIAALFILSGLNRREDKGTQTLNEEESGVDPYAEDVSWIKETERKFQADKRMRSRLSKGANKGKPQRQPELSFPKSWPQGPPQDPEVLQMPDTQLQAQDDELRKKVEAAEYKYILREPVEPPAHRVAGCRNCKPLEPPKECSSLPRSLWDATAEGGAGQRDVETLQGLLGRSLKFAPADAPAAESEGGFAEPNDMRVGMVRQHLKAWKAEPACSFWTRACARRSQKEIRNLPFQQGPEELFPGRVMPTNGTRLFPALQPGELGTCALVGAGSNLSGRKRGWEIDQHDNVFRFADSLIEGYEADVGSKATVLVVKAGKSSDKSTRWNLRQMRNATMYSFERLRDWKNLASQQDEEDFRFVGREMLWPTPLTTKVTARFYSIYLSNSASKSQPQKHVPTSGFSYALAVIASGLCTRVDMYGFSSTGSGRYFQPDTPLSSAHIAGLEQWVYRLAMLEPMHVCVYD
uniref:Alpha--sialyltransferase st3gal i-r2 n=1 Tax=Tetraselmis sp. GSL018 TaxID=582737 RepID=A0A061RAS9_9CHLO|mmetsp:Transcript_41414/g.98153  ORF Transcript_41414/g.98153 Transcript_41414/m.98153 type:complete len:521 (+) Transcript_41414:116-1678(+)|eukprot:CAMPEP_0177586274 /NCGR_PEP_ID=MMETSP0419_2-20121207/4978_1 /TAXON_ID=582737 /ORGANISM="Tetraselmis sp., Strain GSL018" /LENGTH=520 /DNA_ID=CAMNT_0019076141 /DNA_START=26 /DNA_END=1588 /DNA_ORIENTATION=+